MDMLLEKVVLVELMISAWSGSARLTREDIQVSEGQLPPKEIATVGSIKLIDQGETKAFGTLKRAAERAVQKVGVPFMRGYVVSVDLMPELALELDQLKKKYEEETSILIGGYRAKVDTFIAAYPQWAEVMKKKCPREQYLRNQLRFDWLAAQVVRPDDRFSNQIRAGFDRETASLGQRLMQEVAAEANDFYQRSVIGRKEEMTHKTVGALRGILKKLESLSFLNSNAAPVAANLRQVLDSLPRTGSLSPEETRLVSEVAIMLTSADKVVMAVQVQTQVQQRKLDLEVKAIPQPSPPVETTAPADSYSWL
ncbi:MAG: DUF3150 domain-containing protein [Rhizobium sp.]|nr:MAG: DUF3150 domain-containing protein [Rhizobium sp.]